MSRSDYSEDYSDGDQWQLIRWRGAVASAIRGKRGQAFLRELLEALDAVPGHRLVTGLLEDEEGAVCALGAVVKARGLEGFPRDAGAREVAAHLGIPRALASEIMYENDQASPWCELPVYRWGRVRRWVQGLIK